MKDKGLAFDAVSHFNLRYFHWLISEFEVKGTQLFQHLGSNLSLL